jgi:hypothetical protein
VAAALQLIKCVAVEGEAFALRVGAVGTSTGTAFLPFESDPVQVLQQGLGELRSAPAAVQILDSHDESSVSFPGALVGGLEGSCVTEVQQSGRGGGEPAAVNRWSVGCARRDVQGARWRCHVETWVRGLKRFIGMFPEPVPQGGQSEREAFLEFF